MLEFIQEFSNLGFIPHGHCYLWRPELVFLNVAGDAMIGLSYYSIPITIIDFVRRRKDLPFNWIFMLFGAFILSCGTGHLADIWTLWHPDYWLTKGIKTITATASTATAIALITLMPKAIALPSQAQLREANAKLEAEILERQKVQESLQKSEQLLAAYNLDLEFQVKQRTAELESATRTAESANKAKSDFLASISHELRTPLNAVIGFTELMIADSSLPPKQRENVNIINSSGKYLLSLINNILNISRIEAGQDWIELSVFNLPEHLETLRAMMIVKAKSKNLALVFDYSAQLPEFVETDAQKLKQILINLIGNALKFTNHGQITISVCPLLTQDFTLQFTVNDTGIGISELDLPNLFTYYNSASKRSPDGTGLGLYLSKKLIESLGGKIAVTSQLNLGTTFIFTIPVNIPVSGFPSSTFSKLLPTQISRLAPDQPQCKILVVDDEYANRQLLVKMLSSVGVTVHETSNGMDAVDRWRQERYALIYMDLQMPITDGYEATKIIRSITDHPQPKIIALTANMFADRQLIVEIGCNDLLYKPFKSYEVFDMLTKHLELKLVCERIGLNNNINHLVITSDFVPKLLNSLPPKLVFDLERAIHSADLDILKWAIAEIRAENMQLADVIES